MNVKDFEYRFNLASTHTVKDIQEWNHILNNRLDVSINKENTISLYDLVHSFNKIYNCFKRDLEMLPKYAFGNSIYLVRYLEKSEKSINEEYLMLYIDEPNKSLIDAENTFLQIWNKNNEYKSYVTNNINPLDKDYYFNEVSIDKEVLKQHLSFFKKYHLFIDTWKRICNGYIFSNGTSLLYFNIDGDIMEELSKITIEFGNYFMNTSEEIKIPILMENDIIIDYDNSIIKFHDIEENNKVEIINDLLKNIYVHRNNISLLYENKEEVFFNDSNSTEKENGVSQKILKR